MTQGWTRISRRTLFTYFVLSGLIFLFAPPKLTGKLQLAYARLFSWPLATGRGIMLASRDAAPAEDLGRTDYGNLRAAYRRLENDVANCQAKLEEAHKRIEELTRVRMVPSWERMGFLPADVTTVAGQAQNELIINRGRDDGVTVNQYVLALSDHCIVGRVCDVSAPYAKVRLMTDAASKIPVTIAGLDVRRVMEGHVGNVAKIRLVPATHQVRPGDLVYAAKEPGLLDVPIIAGKITACQRDPDSPELWDITVEPVCDIANLSSVAVIMPAAQVQ
jgi:cell shape-determining protein MreC